MIKTLSFRMITMVAALGLVLALLTPMTRVDALTSSSLTLGDSRPSATSTYTVDTTSFVGSSINCIQLDIGTAVNGTGDAGLDLSSLTLDSHTMVANAGWTVSSVDGATDQLRATFATGEVPVNGNIVWGGVVNGATADTTYYGLFETYGNIDCSTGGPIDSAVVTLIYKDGALVSLTIDPTLTFTVAGVAASAPVNTATTTVLSTATAVAFGNSVTSSANGVSAHDLIVGTNATGGYTLYIKHTGLLTNGASDTITNWTGTNLAPTSFTGAGTEAWGYTTDDATLQTGTANRFTNAGPNWAGFSTTNEIVGDSAASDTTRVGHQVAVATSTEAGTYQTTIVYTVASVY